ncbi:MAG TPA: lysylphosphatidylglycerol synthase transmembrane domain-containing protein [Oligoflexia bacterium]|nr:lysylphosphatidylglycerol synthase transmembrane domain-containing protein [Oligoflexia bacterium]HMP26429.1 lysylphosphatidylglycerol synthase transmembrane domain-containing protein [Oligoflexia bacterium]
MKKVIKNGVALFILFFVLWLASPRDTLAALANLRALDILLLLLLSALLIGVSSYKWGLFLAEFGERPSFWRLFALYLMGYFVNIFAPSYLGGDLTRSYLVGKKLGQHQALSATILERYTGLLAMLFLALLFVWSDGKSTGGVKLSVVAIALLVAVSTVVALLPGTIFFSERFLPYGKIAARHLSRIQDLILLASAKRVLLLKAFLISLVFHSLTVLNTLVCAWAVGWDSVYWFDLYVVLPMILLIGALPVTPQGLGVQEGAFFYYLTAVGATPAQALGIALILRAKSYVLAVFGGLVAWFYKKNQ